MQHQLFLSRKFAGHLGQLSPACRFALWGTWGGSCHVSVILLLGPEAIQRSCFAHGNGRQAWPPMALWKWMEGRQHRHLTSLAQHGTSLQFLFHFTKPWWGTTWLQKDWETQYVAEKRLPSYRREAQIFRTQLAFSATTGKHFIIQLHVKESTLRNIYSIKSLLWSIERSQCVGKCWRSRWIEKKIWKYTLTVVTDA